MKRLRAVILANTTFIAACAIAIGWLLSSGSAAQAKPRLVVVVVIDQFPHAYLNRLGGGLKKSGLIARVRDRGAVYDACRYQHAFTLTGPGHATLSTGAYPHVSGIIGNSWFDRSSDATVNCVLDADAKVIGAPDLDGASPRNLLVPTLGDAMKLATGGRAKVFAVGLKDRAALLTAGHMADGAFWFDVLSGAFVTSSAYKDRLPPYIRVINESQSLRQYAGKSWKLLDDRGTYTFHRPDDSPLELPGYNLSKAFPHTLTTEFPSEEFNRQFSATYFANEFTLKLASAIIDTEQLGRDDTADLLFVNFSANDYVGHHFGPYSVEVEDMFRRTDQMLGDFTRLLDSVVGPGKWTLAVSSDHGVAPIPEFAAEIGLKGIRDPLGDLEKFTAHLESLLQARFPSKDEAKIVQFVEKSQVFLNYAHPLLKGPKRSRVIQTTRDLLLAHPSVAVAVSRDDLLKGGGGGGPLRRRFFRAFHAGRSGDVLFAHHPYQFAPGDYTTSHGSPWDYDSHVAMMLLGDGVKQLRSDHPCDPSQLAVTLANLLGIGPPAAANPAPLP